MRQLRELGHEAVHGKEKFPWPLTSPVSEYKGDADLHIPRLPLRRQGKQGTVLLLLTASFSFFKCKSSLKPQTPTKGSWKMEGKKGINRG